MRRSPGAEPRPLSHMPHYRGASGGASWGTLGHAGAYASPLYGDRSRFMPVLGAVSAAEKAEIAGRAAPICGMPLAHCVYPPLLPDRAHKRPRDGLITASLRSFHGRPDREGAVLGRADEYHFPHNRPAGRVAPAAISTIAPLLRFWRRVELNTPASAPVWPLTETWRPIPATQDDMRRASRCRVVTNCRIIPVRPACGATGQGKRYSAPHLRIGPNLLALDAKAPI